MRVYCTIDTETGERVSKFYSRFGDAKNAVPHTVWSSKLQKYVPNTTIVAQGFDLVEIDFDKETKNED